VEVQGAHKVGGRTPTLMAGCGPLWLILSPIFFINSKKCLRGFAGHSENFSFLNIKQHHGNSAENSASPG